MTALTEQFVLATNERPGALDWDVAEVLLTRADGMPAVAGRKIKDAATSAASGVKPSADFFYLACDRWNMRSRRSRLASQQA